MRDMTKCEFHDELREKCPICARAATIGTLTDDNMKLRYMLWLRHDAQHAGVLYGDDGEMQCAACGIDFRRFSVKEIEARFTAIGIERLARAELDKPARAVIVHVTSSAGMWLMKRKPPLIFHGQWATPGGHIEPGETALQAAVREIKEEMAITADPERFIPFGPPSHHVRPNGTRAVLEYFLLHLRDHEPPMCTEPEKHTPWECFDHRIPPRPVTPGTEIAIGRWLTWGQPQ
ncbi:MAG: NUDIX hydrolase [Salinibacterium sp.]|nr:MAG: NUDIX hydrolase [Salinibacterium sp.]